MQQHPPGAASSHDVAQAVEEFAQGMITLRCILSHQAQRGGAKGPFLITDIAWINGSSRACHFLQSRHQCRPPQLRPLNLPPPGRPLSTIACLPSIRRHTCHLKTASAQWQDSSELQCPFIKVSKRHDVFVLKLFGEAVVLEFGLLDGVLNDQPYPFELCVLRPKSCEPASDQRD
jgi:hypothetical protein